MTTQGTVDFSRFDNRDKKEIGQTVQLCHPNTREPLESEGKPCNVVLRAASSHSFQSMMRAKRRAELATGSSVVSELVVIEDTHNTMIDAAVPFVLRFENVFLADDDGNLAPLGSDEESIRRFLDLTFPVFGKLPDSEEVGLLNWPFSSQILDAAQKALVDLGK